MSFWRTIGSHPVEVATGLTLTLLGVFFTASGADAEPSLKVLQFAGGGVATAMGGVLLSWTVGKSLSRQQALAELKGQLGLVSGNIGQASAQIGRVVEQCQQSEMHPATGFALISQGTTSIYAQVSAIQNILGDRFNATNLLDTVTELEDLANKLGTKSSSNSDVGKVVTRLKEVRQELTRNGVYPTTSESVDCPHCQHGNRISIGVNAGDTAKLVCVECSREFNAHRRSGGTVFSRAMGPLGISQDGLATVPKELIATDDVTCPDCQAKLPIKRRLSGELPDRAVCVDCGASLSLSDSKPTVTSKWSFVDAEVAGKSGNRPTVYCPSCVRSINCLVTRNSNFYGLDPSCKTIFRVSHDAFHNWKQVPA